MKIERTEYETDKILRVNQCPWCEMSKTYYHLKNKHFVCPDCKVKWKEFAEKIELIDLSQ